MLEKIEIITMLIINAIMITICIILGRNKTNTKKEKLMFYILAFIGMLVFIINIEISIQYLKNLAEYNELKLQLKKY